MGMAGDVQEVAEVCEGLLLRAAQSQPQQPRAHAGEFRQPFCTTSMNGIGLRCYAWTS